MKYHLGAEGTFTSADGATTKVSLTSNPSHLEAVNPVLEGIVRAKQDIIDKGVAGFTVLPVLLHGDAAFAGQGVVAETLQMGQLRGYRTGGTFHVVINNQVGFTTAPEQSRSSAYSTDVARTVQAPIFHVNGDDPEACVRVAQLAFDFLQEFKKDVVLDLVCYRRRGHNEGDDPSMTQPLMYDVIDGKRSVRKVYTEQLVGRGDITLEEAEEALRDYQAQLERVFAETREVMRRHRRRARRWTRRSTCRRSTPPSGQDVLDRIGRAHVELPDDFTPHPKLAPLMQRARQDGAPTAGSTGPWASCSRSARCCSRAAPSAWPARTPGAARSCSGTPCSSTAGPAPSTPRCATSAGRADRRRSTSTTPCSASTPRSASSTATPSPGPRPS